MTKPTSTFVLIPILTLATSLGWSQTVTPSDAGVSTTAGAGVSATELAKIQAYLNSRYMASDVWRTFIAATGQTIDCIDWFAQPSVKAMAAKGTPITQIPTPPPLPTGLVKASIPDWALNGVPDNNGVPRTCAPNGVAMVRVTVAEILAAGGLDAYLARPRGHGGPPATYNSPGYAHEKERFNGSLNPVINYGQSVLSINSPTIPQNYSSFWDHSISQTWMLSGTGYNICQNGMCSVPGQSDCATACVQTFETGWDVESGASTASFFIFGTNDGYTTACYANSCASFIYIPGNWIWDTYPLPVNLPGSNWQQWELQVVTFNYDSTWWLWVNGGYIGFFESAALGWNTNFFTGMMQNAAQDFQAGGEVYDDTSTWVVPMGSGASATAGFEQSAYMHDFLACDQTLGLCLYDFSPVTGTDRGAYNYSTYNPNPYWNNSFFFGNAPAVFWGQNYNYASPPQNGPHNTVTSGNVARPQAF